jgi:hypothetical protein
MTGDPSPASERRLRLDLLVGAGVLVAVLLVGKAISGGNRTATPSPSPTQSTPRIISVGPSTSAAPTVSIPAPLPLPQADPTKCPRTIRCFTQQGGNGLALEPVMSRFPSARILLFRSVRILTNPFSGKLWYRHVQFRISGKVLDIQITAPYGNDLGEVGRKDGLMYVRFPLSLYQVAASYPPGNGMSERQLRAIATDVRLLQV